MSDAHGWRRWADLLLLIPRSAGAILCAFGAMKLADLRGTSEFFSTLGLPLPLLSAVAAGLIEAVGGLLLAVGLQARLAAVPVLVTMLVAYFSAHRDQAFHQARPFWFTVSAALLLALGAGRWSVDGWLRGRAAERSGA